MRDGHLSRRSFVTAGMALAAVSLAGCGTSFRTFGSVPAMKPKNPEKFRVPRVNMEIIPRAYHRQRVPYETKEKPGTIIVDTKSRHLFLVEEDDTAIRYGIGVGRQGFEWKGRATIRRKAKWPRWIPPKEMVARDPVAAKYKDGWDPGPTNPLGARALYLYKGGRDTLYRIHGTNQPRSIGKAMSSGCVRMLNHDVVDLYERVPNGTKVVVL